MDRSSNTWSCKSCAHEGAGVVAWVMRCDAVSRHAAVERLRSGEPLTRAGIVRRGGRGRGRVQESTVRELPGDLDVHGDDELLAAVVAYYHRSLLESPDALAWLQRRGLRHPELVETFRIGLSDRTLGLKLPKTNRKDGAAVRERLHRLGLTRASGHETFNGCITFPMFDAAGHVTQIYGRKVRDDLRAGTPLHVMLHDDKRGVFNPSAFGTGKSIILTEGVADALTFWVAGIRNVTCTFGRTLTPDVRAALVEHGVERVLVAFDRDEEGDGGAEVVATELAGLGMEVLRVVFPAGQDANDFARSVEDPAEALARLVRHPEWIAGKGRGNAPRTARRAPSSSPSSPTVPEGASDDEMVVQLDDRRWRIRGLSSNTAPGTMRLNVLVSREHVGFHVDLFDLYSSRHRAQFVRLASEELCLDEVSIKKDLGNILLAAELTQDELLRRQRDAPVAAAPVMTEDERAAAMDLLRDPRLLDRVVEDLDRCGLVGERTNATILYLAVTSRLLDDPLGIVVQSSSAAGKSSLMDAVLAFVPPEHRREFSAMTGQALYYVAAGELRHKVLALAEEEGSARAGYALKLLQSEGRLAIASTVKDTTTGRLVTREYVVEGPVALLMTTTSLDLDPELANRCVVIAVDESPEQTRRIHERQRASVTLDGLLARAERDRVRKLHQDAQRLLAPLHVVVPADAELGFDGHGIRSRRDHKKVLGLVRATTLLHQHQREVHVHQHGDDGHELRYLVATVEDAAVATRMFNEVTGNGLADVPPQTRRVLDVLVQVAGPESDGATLERISDALGIGRTRAWVHLRRLRALDYLVAGRVVGQPLRFKLVSPPTSTTQDPGPVRPDAGLHSPLDEAHSPPFAPRSGVAEIEISETKARATPRGGEVAKSRRRNARTGRAEKSGRTATSPGRRRRGKARG